jgi:nucleoside-diphosphate-sugar epimerase
MAKVLVTGASGFIGQHLVGALRARGDEVSCLVRRTSKVDQLKPLDVQFVYGDVMDAASLPAAVSRVDVVYHVAGLTKALTGAELREVNEQGARNVAQACAARQSPPVMVLVSSLAAAGPSPRAQPRTEAEPPRPVSTYGRSKLAGEVAATQFADRLPLSIVRPPMVYGAGDTTGTLAIFQPIAIAHFHPVPGVGRARFSLIHARDLAAALIAAADRGRRVERCVHQNGAQGIYFAAGDETPSYTELGRMIGEALGNKWTFIWPWHGELVLLPVGVAAEAIGRLRRRPLSLNFDKVREATAGSWTCSSQALKNQTGFAPTVPLGQGLRETAEWYRRGGWL